MDVRDAKIVAERGCAVFNARLVTDGQDISEKFRSNPAFNRVYVEAPPYSHLEKVAEYAGKISAVDNLLTHLTQLGEINQLDADELREEWLEENPAVEITPEESAILSAALSYGALMKLYPWR